MGKTTPVTHYKRCMAKRILIADDSELIRRMVREMLEEQIQGAVCAEAADGREAVAKAQQIKPDLIVLDLSMPLMNGLEAACEFRRLLPTIPIVMFTSFEGTQIKQLALSLGFRDVVPREAPTQLFRSVRVLLGVAA
jgi:CheY-like chemotaxis protein